MNDEMEWIVRFELPNGGDGPETVTTDDLAAEYDVVCTLLLREHYCQVSRERARAFDDALDAFEDRDVAVVAALPDDSESAAYWQRRYDLSYPVLADAPARASGDGNQAMTDGAPRFGELADVEIALECLPGVGVLDTRSKWPRLVDTIAGDTIQGSPTPPDVLDRLDDLFD
jgi:hypothetical protein